MRGIDQWATPVAVCGRIDAQREYRPRLNSPNHPGTTVGYEVVANHELLELESSWMSPQVMQILRSPSGRYRWPRAEHPGSASWVTDMGTVFHDGLADL